MKFQIFEFKRLMFALLLCLSVIVGACSSPPITTAPVKTEVIQETKTAIPEIKKNQPDVSVVGQSAPKNGSEIALNLLNEDVNSSAPSLKKVPADYSSIIKLENYEVVKPKTGVSMVLFSSDADKKGGYKTYFFKESPGGFKPFGSMGIYVSKIDGNKLPIKVYSKKLPNGKLTVLLKQGGNLIAQNSIDMQDLLAKQEIVFDKIEDLKSSGFPIRATLVFE
jgi:hypothetical protein